MKKVIWLLLSIFVVSGVFDEPAFASETAQSAVASQTLESSSASTSDSEEVSIIILNEGMNVKGPESVVAGSKGKFVITTDQTAVDFDGEYIFDYDESLIKVDNEGNWEALKSGKVSIQYGYRPSEKMWQALEEKLGADLFNNLYDFAVFNMTITEKPTADTVINIGMTLSGAKDVTVGEKGKFDIKVDYEGIAFDGEYVFYYDESLIKIDSDGNWEALKSGKASIIYGYRPSEKMWQLIDDHFNGVEQVYPDTALVHEMTITQETSSDMVINTGMTLRGPKEVKVGEKGTFDIQIDYEGIAFDGEYVFNYDESLIKIDNKGNWEALKAGKVTIVYGYKPSEKMWQAIDEHFNGVDQAYPDIAMIHEMTIMEEQAADIVLNTGMTLNGPTNVTVGDKGKFDITVDYEGVAFDGEYVFYYDESLIKIDSDGNWEALKSGEATITYGYRPSEKMLSDLKTHFGGEIPPQPSIAMIHIMTIADKAVDKIVDNNGSGAELPKTGTTPNAAFVILGFTVLGFAVVVKRQQNRKTY